jgi:hypothetical protein
MFSKMRKLIGKSDCEIGRVNEPLDFLPNFTPVHARELLLFFTKPAAETNIYGGR